MKSGAVRLERCQQKAPVRRLACQVLGGSAAAKAGLLGTRRELSGIVAGDVVVEADDTKIATPAALAQFLDSKQVCDDVLQPSLSCLSFAAIL